MRRADAIGHVLVVDRAGRVVVTADPADPAGDEVRVARVLALHEDAVAAEDRRGAVALGDRLGLEVDLGVDTQAAYDPRDGIPRHLGQFAGFAFGRRHRLSPRLLVAGPELGALRPPLGLLVQRARGEPAKGADDAPVHHGGRGRHPRTRRLVHERHELVGEAGHGAGDADAADVRAAADAVDPAALGHVALDHRAPAAQLDQAARRAVLGGELTLLVVAGPVAALVHGGLEQPLRPQRLVQRDHRRLTGYLVQQVQDG